MELHRRIELYLRRNRISPTRFGREAASDPRFVFDLRKGRELRDTTAARIAGWLDVREAGVILADPGEELKRALGVNFVDFGGPIDIKEVATRPWASITFAGARHHFRLNLRGEGAAAAADAFLTGLSEREFRLRGHILADIALIEDVRDEGSIRLTLEALTVEAA